MRKLMMAVVAVAGLGLVAGCRENVQEKRQDVAEAQQDLQQARQEVPQEMAEARQDAMQDVREERQDLTEEQRELAEARQERMQEQQERMQEQQEGTGGGAMAGVKTEEVEGTIQSTSGNTIAIIVPDKNNQLMRFQANQQLQVMKDDRPVALTDLKAGDEVRASYQMDPNGQMMLKSIEVEKMSAQHPGQKSK